MFELKPSLKVEGINAGRLLGLMQFEMKMMAGGDFAVVYVLWNVFGHERAEDGHDDENLHSVLAERFVGLWSSYYETKRFALENVIIRCFPIIIQQNGENKRK